MDATLAAIALVALSPLLLLIALLVRWTSPGGILFVQERVGLGCRTFRMWKFRTMHEGAHEAEAELHRSRGGHTFFKLEDDPRITRLGRFLRRYSLDELPQLWNVIRGEMSLVGPRPLLLTDMEKFPLREQARRFAVRPGMTGLWQVSGRSRTTDAERMRLDLQYVDGWSLRLDLEILGRTPAAVFRAEGAV